MNLTPATICLATVLILAATPALGCEANQCSETPAVYECAEGVLTHLPQAGYHDNQECHWIIAPPQASVITLQFTAFDTEEDYDKVWIYRCFDTTCSSTMLIAMLSGDSLPAPLEIEAVVLRIDFEADDSVNHQGFALEWSSSAPTTPHCNISLLVLPSHGFLSHDCGTSGMVAPGDSCQLSCEAEYTPVGIQPWCGSDGQFQGDYSCAPSCNTSGAVAPANGVLHEACAEGSTLRHGGSCNTTCNAGFVAAGRPATCEFGVLDRGSISCISLACVTDKCHSTPQIHQCEEGLVSHLPPDGYADNQECQWIIAPPLASFLTLQFTSFNTEEDWDEVTVYQCSDSSCSERMLLESLSGETLPSPIEVHTGVVQVTFVADDIIALDGFAFKWITATPCAVSSLAVPAHGVLNHSCATDGKVAVGDSCEIGCDAGYTAVGTQPWCGADGFVGEMMCAEFCNVSRGSGLLAPENGVLDSSCAEGTSIRHGESCNATCNAGFVRVGNPAKCEFGMLDSGSISCLNWHPDCDVFISIEDDALAIIEAAQDGSTVCLAPGVHKSACGIPVRGKHLRIRGFDLENPEGDMGTILDCEMQMSHFVASESALLELSGLYLRNGSVAHYHEWNGACVLAWEANLTVSNCIFERCRGTRGSIYVLLGALIMSNTTVSLGQQEKHGGGVVVRFGSATFSGCTFSKNSVTGGYGGAVVVQHGSATFKSCTFTQNQAWAAGGVHIDRTTATFEDCIFASNRATDSVETYMGGGGLHVLEGDAGVFRCIFQDNEARINGGAIYVAKDITPFFDPRSDVTLRLKDCLFSENVVLQGDGGAVALYQAENSTIENCSFLNNSADAGNGGGIFQSFGRGTVRNCEFINNHAQIGGGAMSVEGELAEITTTSCIFDLNSCADHILSVSSQGSGGAASCRGGSSITFVDTNFSGNVAQESGGAVSSGFSCSMALIRTNLISNSVWRSSGVGGAIAVSGNAYFIESNLIANFVNGEGGALHLGFSGSAGLVTCRIEDNMAVMDGGGIYSSEEAFLTMENSIIHSNSAAGDGGGAWLRSPANLAECSFSDSFASYGGAIYAYYTSILLEGCNVSDNQASEGGGAIYSIEATITTRNSLLLRNVAAHMGGGTFLDDRSSLYAVKSTFEANAAMQSGGALFMWESSSSIIKSNLLSNTAKNYGGAIYIKYGSSLNLSDSQVLHNVAEQGGGVAVLTSALDQENSRVAVFTSAIDQNRATQGGAIRAIGSSFIDVATTRFAGNTADDGGAICSSDDCGVCISSSLFGKNTAMSGGAIRLWGESTLALSDSSLVDNSAEADGGAIHVSDSSSVTARLTNFTSNSAHGDGGAIFVWSALTLLNSAFSSNVAARDGGAVYLTGPGSKIVSEECTLERNTADESGGAIVATAGSTAYLSMSHLINNSALDDGGALVVEAASAAIIRKCEMSSNFAGNQGGALAVTFHSSVEADQILVSHNFAQGSGGGYVATTQGVLTLTDSLFVGNQGLAGGGLSILNRGSVTMRNSNLISNTAQGGGAVYSEQSRLEASDSSIAQNRAHSGGGGMETANSDVQLHSVSITSNTAKLDGGGILLRSSILATTATLIANNSANHGGGGAIHGTQATLTIHNSTLSTNVCDDDGGGILITSSVLRMKRTNLERNSANCGGAIGILASQFEAEDMFFVSNHARTGGALCAKEVSQVKLSHTKFAENRAFVQGGAIIQFGGDLVVQHSEFKECSSFAFGGALSAQPVEDANPTEASESFPRTTIEGSVFALNKAGSDGGAIHVANAREFISMQSIYTANAADRVGGSMLLLNSVSRLRNNQFVQSSAGSGGGALFWTKLEPAVEGGMRALCSKDSGNTAAWGSCFASNAESIRYTNLYSGAPHVGLLINPGIMVHLADHYGQTLRSESDGLITLRWAGGSNAIAELSTVDLLGSLVQRLEKGSTNFSGFSVRVGVAIDMSRMSATVMSTPQLVFQGEDPFTQTSVESAVVSIELGNGFEICPPGHVLLNDGTKGFCFRCEAGTYSLHPVSSPEEDASSPQCFKCPEGADCSKGGDEVVPKAGYWIKPKGYDFRPRRGQPPNRTEIQIFACAPGACREGGLCHTGRIGPLCSLCAPGWVKSPAGCTQCDRKDRAHAIWIYSVLGLLAIVLWYVMTCRPVLIMTESKAKSAKWDRLKGYCKVVISFLQILATFLTNLDVPWPNLHVTIMQFSAAASIDPRELPTLNCAGSQDYLTKVLIYTLGPVVVVVLIILPSALLLLWDYSKGSPSFWISRRKEKAADTIVDVGLMFLFLVYPVCSQHTLLNLSCKDLGDGLRLMSVDLSLICPWDDRQGFIFLYSICFAALYVVGIPILSWFALKYHKVDKMSRQKYLDEAITKLVGMYRKKTLNTEEARSAFHHLSLEDIKIQGHASEFLGLEEAHIGDTPTKKQKESNRSKPLPISEAIAFLEFHGLLVDSQRELCATSVSNVALSNPLFPSASSAQPHALDVANTFHGNETLRSIEDQHLWLLLRFQWDKDSEDGPVAISSTNAVQEAMHLSSWTKRRGQEDCPALQMESVNPANSPVPPLSRELLEKRLETLIASLQKRGIVEIGQAEWDSNIPSEDAAMRRAGSLFRAYKVKHWWFGFVELARRIILTTLTRFVLQGSFLQVVIAFLTAFVFLLVFMWNRPFRDPRMQKVSNFAMMALCITLLYAISLKGTTKMSVLPEQLVSGISLLVAGMNLSVLFFPFWVEFWSSRQLQQHNNKEDNRREWLQMLRPDFTWKGGALHHVFSRQSPQAQTDQDCDIHCLDQEGAGPENSIALDVESAEQQQAVLQLERIDRSQQNEVGIAEAAAVEGTNVFSGNSRFGVGSSSCSVLQTGRSNSTGQGVASPSKPSGQPAFMSSTRGLLTRQDDPNQTTPSLAADSHDENLGSSCTALLEEEVSPRQYFRPQAPRPLSPSPSPTLCSKVSAQENQEAVAAVELERGPGLSTFQPIKPLSLHLPVSEQAAQPSLQEIIPATPPETCEGLGTSSPLAATRSGSTSPYPPAASSIAMSDVSTSPMLAANLSTIRPTESEGGEQVQEGPSSLTEEGDQIDGGPSSFKPENMLNALVPC